jgi:hypothetical protein
MALDLLSLLYYIETYNSIILNGCDAIQTRLLLFFGPHCRKLDARAGVTSRARLHHKRPLRRVGRA